MSRHVALPVVIICVLSQLVVKCPAQWIDPIITSRMAGFESVGQPVGIKNPSSMNIVPNSLGYGIGPGSLYGNALGGLPNQQINYGAGVPLNCIGLMGPGGPGLGYGNGGSLGAGYLAPMSQPMTQPMSQPFGYASGIESNCVSNCLMGAGLDYGNGLGAMPGYPGGTSLPGAFMANPNLGSLNVMPNVIGGMDPSVAGLGNGFSVNPTFAPIPQQSTLSANENTNTNTNVNINNNVGKRQGRLGMLGIPNI